MASPSAAAVIGGRGGIGAALVSTLAKSGEFDLIHSLSRAPATDSGRVSAGIIDVTNEESIAEAAKHIGSPLDLVIVATGILHQDGRMPEKALRDLNGIALARMFEINTVGPALVLKHFSPLLTKERRSVFAVLSARVGSISDNQTGGWYGYRASKAALNMVIKSAAVELARTRPRAICVALHPGTVDTPLSEPFRARVATGKLFSAERAAQQLFSVLKSREPRHSGRIFSWDGSEIAP